MKKAITSISLALLLVTATITPFLPLEEAISLLPETETFTIPVQKDSFLKQGSQAHNEGANVILNIISSDKHRPVLAFDQSLINGTVNGRPLQSAILRLYITENGNNWGSNGNTIGAHRLLSDWHEGNGWNWDNTIAGTGSGVTWGCAIDTDISNNQNDCAAPWDGGSFQSIATGNVLITNNLVNQWVEFNVTSDVQAFLDGTANYGWLIRKTSESQNGSVEFASKEASVNSPELRVTVIKPEAVLANEYLTLIDELDSAGRNLNQTEITQELVNGIDSDLSRIKDILVELQNLGFDGEVSANRAGEQMVGSIKFYDKDTSVLLFETTIPDGTLGIFAAIGLRDQFAEEGLTLPFERVAQLLRASLGFAQVISGFENDEVARDFVLASIAPFHPSTGQTINFAWNAGQLARKIASAFLHCYNFGECKFALDEVAVQLAPEIVQYLFPAFEVTGVKFDDVNGNGERDNQEPGIQGWLFKVSTFNAPRVYDGFTNATGVFKIQGQYPRSTHTLVITEELQNGWIVTTANGQIHERGFTPPPESQFDLVVQVDAGLYGNFRLGEISGFKYNDADGDGVRDSGEGVLAGWSIVLKNATSGEIVNSTTTNSDGLYHFTGLKVGSYRVEEVQQANYTQTAPEGGSYLISIVSGTFSLGNDFGNQNVNDIQTTIYNQTVQNNGRSVSGDTVNHAQFDGMEVKSTSALVGKSFNKMDIWMRRIHTGSGTVYLGIWDTTTAPTVSNAKKIITSFDFLTLDTSPALHSYSFTTWTFSANEAIGMYYAGVGEASIRWSTSNQFDGSNTAEIWYRGGSFNAWVHEPNNDVTMTLVHSGG